MTSLSARLPFSILFLTTIAMLTASCGGKKDATAHVPPPAGPVGTTVWLAQPDGREMETIGFVAGGITITGLADAPDSIGGGLQPNGARRYGAGDNIIGSVTQNDDDAFKLKSPHDNLLWKVKLESDKIKVSDNEENAHPYVLRLEHDYVKVKDDETEIGRVKVGAGNTADIVSDSAGVPLATATGKSGSAAYGVLLMSRVPRTQRLIIMAELLARGR